MALKYSALLQNALLSSLAAVSLLCFSAKPSGSAGIEFGPYGKKIYWVSGRILSILSVTRGRIFPFRKLPFEGGHQFGTTNRFVANRTRRPSASFGST